MLTKQNKPVLSYKLRVAVLIVAIMMVAVVVVFALDNTGEYQDYEYTDYTSHDYNEDDYASPYFFDASDIYIGFSTIDEYMYYMAGEIGDAPSMLVEED